MKLNEYLLDLDDNNTFLRASKEIADYKKNNPDKKFISLGIGDVSKPVVRPIIEAMHKAVDDLSDMKTFKGYGAYYGYDFLKSKILEEEYPSFSLDEIYISNGTKTDSSNILELFDINSKICITDPMYPIYRDGAKALNRNIHILELSENNEFIAEIPKEKYDLIYICSPSNPIGIAYTKEQLQAWVDYAIKNDSIILYDNVYESFITRSNVPKSIYELENARKVAIEFRSFSKKASFTGVRCSYFVIPEDIKKGINSLWKKRTINRFNGADYIAQRGAEASYLETSKCEIKKNIDYYMENASYLRKSFQELGFQVWGGVDAPFMWVKSTLPSWDNFNFFLKELNIIVVPGIVFGDKGDYFFRVSALGKKEDNQEAIERIKKYYEKKI